MSYILWKKIAFVLLVSSFVCASGKAQNGHSNYRNKQFKDYYFGISFGLHKSNLKVLHGSSFQDQNRVKLIESYENPGYDIKVIGNLKVGEYWDFRLLPGFSFGQMELMYQKNQTAVEAPVSLEYVYGELPFHIRYKSHPYKDMRVYVFAGAKYCFDISSKSRTQSEANELNISASDYALEGGIGFQFFFPYFILSPEIKISRGISNILINNIPGQDAGLLQRALSQMLTLSLHFEG
ncbi:type IX secretion/gliding motility protein PorT/SprT [Membranihabitans marinus]|uniref:type IX secretion/gliding motility protein PorT/SprT n=1 Tax=Membranihabitans marinus TaxID=1227546 RepID=UPI001F3A0924|nr:outer membrane beta-barrel protein [Membranihabitans marinus]